MFSSGHDRMGRSTVPDPGIRLTILRAPIPSAAIEDAVKAQYSERQRNAGVDSADERSLEPPLFHDESTESAASWNSLLTWARKYRGPQFDVCTQMYVSAVSTITRSSRVERFHHEFNSIEYYACASDPFMLQHVTPPEGLQDVRVMESENDHVRTQPAHERATSPEVYVSRGTKTRPRVPGY